MWKCGIPVHVENNTYVLYIQALAHVEIYTRVLF